MKTLLLLFASTLFYGIFHFMLVQAIRKSELVLSLNEAQSKSPFEVTPRRLALKLCASVQVVCGFIMGMMVVHDVTTIPIDPYEPRVRVSLLLLPVRGTASSYTLRAVILTSGFWVFHFISDLRRFFFWSGQIKNNRFNNDYSSIKLMQFFKLISIHITPLFTTWIFVHWRHNSFYGNPNGEGLGFPDLLIGLLLTCLLPGLLDNTRWIVYIIDSDSKGTWEALFIDIAIIANRFVCHILIWPYFLLMYYRHEHGGIIDPAFDLANHLSILQAFTSLPLRCSIGTIVMFGVGIFTTWKDVVKAYKTCCSVLEKNGGNETITNSEHKKKRKNKKDKEKASDSEKKIQKNINEEELKTSNNPKQFEKQQSLAEKGVRVGDGDDLEASSNPLSPSSSLLGNDSWQEEDSRINVDELPPSLLKHATSPDEVEWLRAQKRISRMVKEEKEIEKERLAKQVNTEEEEEEEDDESDSDEVDNLLRKKYA
mmetsp:Transcript_30194/g.38953  ORF Transcript_30194/g.38953 Transcript_30194/m.38953 type:complete len:482 (+) Transcript_30194:140-1585(+)